MAGARRSSFLVLAGFAWVQACGARASLDVGSSIAPARDASTAPGAVSSAPLDDASDADMPPYDDGTAPAPSPAFDATASTALSFVSDATWPWFEGNLQGPDGPSPGRAAVVCVSAVTPPNCPGAAAGAVIYQAGDGTGSWMASYPGAYWIWRGDVTPTAIGDLQFAVFQKTFVLGAGPTGTISIAADDMAEVMVNGKVVGTTGSVTDVSVAWNSQNHLAQMDLSDSLVEGANTITIVGQNGPSSFAGGGCSPCPYSINTAGVVFGGTLTSGGTAPR